MIEEIGFPVFKGLQKPLELMGIRGRFIFIAAGVAFAAILSAFILGAVVGKAIGFGVAGGVLVCGYLTIYVKQKKGLHSKKNYQGDVIYKKLFGH